MVTLQFPQEVLMMMQTAALVAAVHPRATDRHRDRIVQVLLYVWYL